MSFYNKNKLAIIAAIAALLHFPLRAQESKEKPNYTPSTGVRAAVMGAIAYPGIKIGIERPFKYKQISKIKSLRKKTVFNEHYATYSLGMYHQYNYHTNYFTQAEWTRRRQKSKGLYLESALGAGLSRTFVHGASYNVTDNGEVEKVPLSGNWHAVVSAGAAIGYNARITKQKPYAIYLKHQWMVLFPYNSVFTPRPTIELGINYTIPNFWRATPTLKTKVKQKGKKQ